MFVLNAYVMSLVLPFFIFMHLHLTSHLGALDEPCEGCDVGGPIPKMEGPLEYMPEQEMLAKRVSSN